MLDLQPAVAEDAVRLHALRDAAARWLQARGIRQWQPGEVEMATFGAQVQAGEWFRRSPRRSSPRRAAVPLVRPAFLGERPDDAGYVHGLVIDRGQAGEGLGGQLLDWAEDRTLQAGRRFLRWTAPRTTSGFAAVTASGASSSWVAVSSATGDPCAAGSR